MQKYGRTNSIKASKDNYKILPFDRTKSMYGSFELWPEHYGPK